MRFGERTNVYAPQGKVMLVYEDPSDPGYLHAGEIYGSLKDARTRRNSMLHTQQCCTGAVDSAGHVVLEQQRP